MFKTINALLLVLLMTACSAQESKEKTETNSTEVKKNIAKVETKKDLVQEKTTDKKEQKKEETTTNNESLFTLTTLEGKSIHIEETKGGLLFREHKDKVVLVLFFGHRCPPCLAEIPVLTALTNKKHKDLEIIAIEVQGYAAEQLKTFKEKKGINYTLVTHDGSSDFITYISKQANWSGAIPFLIGFDKKSVVKVVHAGGLGTEDFDNIYNTLAKGE